MQTTRQRILQYLEKNRQASSPELSQVLDLTQANIRHHLNVLLDDGKIEVIGEIPAEGRGRPTMIYMASRTEQSHALDLLSSLLLLQGQEQATPRQQQSFLRRLAKNLAGTQSQSGSITLRLSSATQYLNELHYEARWEAHADAPHLLFGHCPYGRIITQHPELCQMDLHLLEHLTGTKVEQIEKQARSVDGPHSCKFVLK